MRIYIGLIRLKIGPCVGLFGIRLWNTGFYNRRIDYFVTSSERGLYYMELILFICLFVYLFIYSFFQEFLQSTVVLLHPNWVSPHVPVSSILFYQSTARHTALWSIHLSLRLPFLPDSSFSHTRNLLAIFFWNSLCLSKLFFFNYLEYLSPTAIVALISSFWKICYYYYYYYHHHHHHHHHHLPLLLHLYAGYFQLYTWKKARF